MNSIQFERHPGFYTLAAQSSNEIVSKTEDVNNYFNTFMQNDEFPQTSKHALANEINTINGLIEFQTHVGLKDRLRKIFMTLKETNINEQNHPLLYAENRTCRGNILIICGHLLRLPTLQIAQA